MTRRSLIASIPLVLALGACGYEPPCGATPDCDIRQRACQRRSAELAACLRDEPLHEVPVDVVDAQTFIDELAEQADAADPAEVEASERWFAGLSLIGLASGPLTPGDATAAFYRNVAAFYDGEEESITILDRGSARDSFSDNLLLLHEMVHALQDRSRDLETLYARHATTYDRSLGLDALVEGEAVLQVDRAAVGAYEVREGVVDFDAAYQGFREAGLVRAIYSPEAFIDLRGAFVYPFGAAFVQDAWELGDNPLVRDQYDAPPVSSRQVMRGFGNAEPAHGPWLEDSIDLEGVPVVEGMTLVRRAHAGRFAAQVALERAARTWLDAEALHALRRLRGDVLSVLADADGGVLLAWRMRLSDEAEASALLEAAEARLVTLAPEAERDGADEGDTDGAADESVGPQVIAYRDGRDVIVLASEIEGLAAGLRDAHPRWAPLPPGTEAGELVAAARARIHCTLPSPGD